LRLAVLLNRSRSALEIPDIVVSVGERSIDLKFDGEWLQANPLTIADLDREIGDAKNVGYELTFS
jgi:exopolyphosphatase/guanosine-5'-triphosphate,3'-diphosphate pyrophosphatase